ncbi:DUF6169 family protein [Dyadobacter sp. CY326]|uniref:DUF6169 family protein n=1 Tax=Dyadobacter sp. CY326 TaxID=2907300 RepID=UPI001F35047E|nr:DUF6169 family protein [Dyadobacter sp. CY326]
MHAELNLLNPYEIISEDPEKYWFITQCNIVYIAYFTNSTGYFNSHPEFNEHILSFTFEPAGEEREALYLGVSVSKVLAQSHDKRILDTIITILLHAFKENPRKSIIIICESADNLARCRNRLFNQWFEKANALNGQMVCKYDLTIMNEGFASLFVHRHNMFREKIRDAFLDIPNRVSENKPSN